jgi:hypothetical protein
MLTKNFFYKKYLLRWGREVTINEAEKKRKENEAKDWFGLRNKKRWHW